MNNKVDTYTVPVKDTLKDQVVQSMRDLEELLDRWQNIICKDVETNAVQCYVYPGITKFLMIEFQEYLYILQKIVKVEVPSVKVNFRNSNTVSKTTSDSAMSKSSPSKTKPVSSIATWE